MNTWLPMPGVVRQVFILVPDVFSACSQTFASLIEYIIAPGKFFGAQSATNHFNIDLRHLEVTSVTYFT